VPLFGCSMINGVAMEEMKNNTVAHRDVLYEILYQASWDYRRRHAWIARGQSGTHKPDKEVGLTSCVDKYGLKDLKAWKVSAASHRCNKR